MRILHVISSCNPKIGGPIQGIRNYQNEIHKMGILRDVICFEENTDIIKWNFPTTLNVIGLGKSKGLWQYNKNLIPWLQSNYHNYDYIIINGLWLYNTYGVIRSLKSIKKINSENKIPKIFIMCHGMLDPWFQKSKTRGLKAIRNDIYWHLIERKNVNYVDGLLFTTEQELNLAKKTFRGYMPKKELNIGYGIEEPPVLSSLIKEQFFYEFSIDKNEPYLLFLSRIDTKKGLDLILEAYVYLLKTTTYADKIPNLIIAGPGIDSSYGKKLIKYINKNPVLISKVKYIGHLVGDKKWSAIYNCSAFILQSHTENFGIAVVEALACHKPVLITNKVNIYKEIELGQGGFISEDNVEGTIENITKLINLSSEGKNEIAENAYKVYINNFKSIDAVNRLIKTLNEN